MPVMSGPIPFGLEKLRSLFVIILNSVKYYVDYLRNNLIFSNFNPLVGARVKFLGSGHYYVFEINIPHVTFATTLQKESEN